MLDFWDLTHEDSYYFFILFLIDQLYIHLDVQHPESAERVVTFLNEVYNNQEEFFGSWLMF